MTKYSFKAMRKPIFFLLFHLIHRTLETTKLNYLKYTLTKKHFSLRLVFYIFAGQFCQIPFLFVYKCKTITVMFHGKAFENRCKLYIPNSITSGYYD